MPASSANTVDLVNYAPPDAKSACGQPWVAARKDDVPRGILAMVGATLCFALSSAFAKYQVALHPVGQVMFLRSISSLLVCAIFILPLTGLAIFKTSRPKAHLARGLAQSISQTLSVLALSLMPLAGAISINFSAPIWAALVSILWLKERPGIGRWAFLAIGFIGVVVVARPGADSLQMGAVFALANAIMYGSVTVAVRGMTKTESSNTLIMWQMLTVAAFHSLLLPFGFDRLSISDVAMLACSGIANAAGQCLWTKALRLGPATAVSPFYYLTLVWALIIGFLAWGDVPSLTLIIGSCVVVISGLLLLWRESQVGQRPYFAGRLSFLRDCPLCGGSGGRYSDVGARLCRVSQHSVTWQNFSRRARGAK